jgi:hypothetical protein
VPRPVRLVRDGGSSPRRPSLVARVRGAIRLSTWAPTVAPMTDVDLSQRRVVVTGASSGIGAAAVRRLFRMGAEVHSWGGRGSGPLP